jgi:hypothetical protein
MDFEMILSTKAEPGLHGKSQLVGVLSRMDKELTDRMQTLSQTKWYQHVATSHPEVDPHRI